MAASATDKFRKTARRWVGQIGAGGVSDDTTTTVPLASATNLPTDTGVTITIDRVDANGVATPLKEETVTGVVSGSNVVSCVRGVEGTAQAHDAGAVVEVLFSNAIWGDFIDGVVVEHGQDGKHKSATVTTLKATGADVTTGTSDVTIVTPKALADAGFVLDTDGTMAANSDSKVPSQKAVKTFVTAYGTTDGWTSESHTWTQASANSFTISGVDMTATFVKGTKVKCTNNSTTYYGVVASSSFSTNTTVTLIANTDYSLAASAITAPFYSYQAIPRGFPTWFTYTSTYTASGSMTIGSITVRKSVFAAQGQAITVIQNIAGTVGGTPSTELRFTLPVAALTSTQDYYGGGCLSYTTAYLPGSWTNNNATEIAVRTSSGGSWTAGTQYFFLNMTYQF